MIGKKLFSSFLFLVEKVLFYILAEVSDNWLKFEDGEDQTTAGIVCECECQG
jgi:hypothetical protein